LSDLLEPRIESVALGKLQALQLRKSSHRIRELLVEILPSDTVDEYRDEEDPRLQPHFEFLTYPVVWVRESRFTLRVFSCEAMPDDGGNDLRILDCVADATGEPRSRLHPPVVEDLILAVLLTESAGQTIRDDRSVVTTVRHEHQCQSRPPSCRVVAEESLLRTIPQSGDPVAMTFVPGRASTEGS
jgi:hypothetical protein